MTLPNHIAGGIVFTGVFGGIAGVNILESPGLLIVTVIGATIADVDLPQSLWGKIFGPVSRTINRRFGHRTITHSLLFMAMLGVITKAVCEVFEIEGPYLTVMLLGYFSHLLFDMMTVQGVPIFYPYKKNPCVIPADPNMRFNSNNRRSEIAIFGFFVMSGLFMQPLMSDGFWTTYNRMFGTIQHLQSEFEKSEDLLLAKYRYREASNEYEDSGYVIEASGDFAVLWDEKDGWKYIDGNPKSLKTLLEVIPEHTGKKFEIKRQSFVSLTKDSLESILSGAVVYEVHLSGNKQFGAVYAANGQTERAIAKNMELKLVDYLNLSEVPVSEKSKSRVQKVRYKVSPRIRTLESSIKKLKRKEIEEMKAYQNHKQQLQDVETRLSSETDIYQRTTLQRALKKLKGKEVDLPDYSDQVAEIEIQVLEIIQNDNESYHDRREAATAAEEEGTTTISGPLLLTGILTTIEFGT